MSAAVLRSKRGAWRESAAGAKAAALRTQGGVALAFAEKWWHTIESDDRDYVMQ